MPTNKKTAVHKPVTHGSREASKIFDVSRPGKTAANSTSKPVIITNRPVIQDPMVTAAAAPNEPTTAPVLQAAKKLVIKPLHSNVVPDPPAAAVDIIDVPMVAEVSKPEPSPLANEPLPTPVPQTIPFSETVSGIPTQNSAVTDNMIKPAETPPVQPANTSIGIPVINSDKQLSPAQTDATELSAQSHAAQLQRLIDKEQYFLPINTKEDRRNKRFAILGLLLVIILGLAWYNTALDAGLLNNTYNLPHSHFFTVQTH